MSYRVDNLVTDGRTDAGNDNTQRPKLASGKNKILNTKSCEISFVYNIHFSAQIISKFHT